MSKAKEFLNEVSKRLNKVVIENQDFEKIINNYDKKGSLFYLDPPYYQVEKYYQNRFQPEDHVRLKETLDKIEGKFVLSYNDCKYIRNLYRNYKIIKVERLNNLAQKEEKPIYQELIIKNYT